MDWRLQQTLLKAEEPLHLKGITTVFCTRQLNGLGYIGQHTSSWLVHEHYNSMHACPTAALQVGVSMLLRRP
jgi:hypothetical protein